MNDWQWEARALIWNKQDFIRGGMVRKTGGCGYAEQQIAQTEHTEGETFVDIWGRFQIGEGSLG